ncbi:MAG: hypothetical protein U0802_10635 [Candidatus Binatia bacterium]
MLTPAPRRCRARGPDALLLSGAGGFISHYIVGSEILGLGGSLLDTLFFWSASNARRWSRRRSSSAPCSAYRERLAAHRPPPPALRPVPVADRRR